MFVVKIQTHSGVLPCELCSCCSECLSQHTENRGLGSGWCRCARGSEASQHRALWEQALSPSQGELTSLYGHYRSSDISARVLTTSKLGSLCSESHSGADLSWQNQTSAGWGSKQPCSSGPSGIPSLTRYLQPGPVHKECKHISKCFSQLTCQASQQGICLSGIKAFSVSHADCIKK